MRSTFLLIPLAYVLTVACFQASDGNGRPSAPLAGAAEPAPQATFGKEGVAFLAKHCIVCHGEKKKRADLTLHTYKDDAALLMDRKTWHKVLGVLQSGEMPPQERPRPPLAEVEVFTRTITTVFDKADRSGKRDPGRVTIRRLNRAEYNNTIRDLVGVDFQPAEDFPSDDVGHGFDNIGDVLSLSPILLERYLAAAESIVQRAIIVGEPPKPPKRHLIALFLGSSVPGTPREQDRFRKLVVRGDFHTQYTLTVGGDFKFRVKGYAEQAGDQFVQITFRVDGKDLKTVDVTATSKEPGVYEVPVPLEPGPHNVAVRFDNPTPDGPEAVDKRRGFFIQYFELEGPMDTLPPSHRRLLAHKPGQGKAENTREILTRFASQAYRRPATQDEVARLVKLVEQAEARGEKWEAGLQLAIQAVLVSPKFLFRVELDDRPDSAEPHPIGEYQLASRLSYFLWSSMPDSELFDLAAKGQLSKDLESQVQRMLKDPKARALVDNFATQWLQVRNLKNFMPDPKLFPNFDETLRSAMFKETELFFEAIVREDRSILDLIDADYTFLNERLARHYGIADTNGNVMGQKPTWPGGKPIRGKDFVRVSLEGNSTRGGILTQASILAVTSNPTRTSPVKRGRWVLDQLLGTPPPPPPPDVPELAANEKAVLSGSLRQRMEQHRANPSCASCHARMDPIGFAFENFDAIGAFRTKDAGFPIDPSGTLPSGQSFQGPAELKAILKGKKDLFSRCLTEKLLTYALGRGLDYYDKRAVDMILAALARNDYKFSTLAVEIAKSEPFRLRRGKDGQK